MTIGPMVAWRRITPSGLRRVLAAPLGFAVLVALLLSFATNAADSLPSLKVYEKYAPQYPCLLKGLDQQLELGAQTSEGLRLTRMATSSGSSQPE